MTTPQNPPPLTPGMRHWYGLGQAAEGLLSFSFSYFLIFYYTGVVGLSGRLAGVAVLISLLFDAVTDPLAGVVSDRAHSRWGRRHPFLYASALPMAVTFLLTWLPPRGMGELALFTWLVALSVLARLFLTLFYVPHMALGAELSRDYEERNRVVATRQFFGRVGANTAGLLGLGVYMRSSADYADGRLDPTAYPPFAATVALLILAAVLLSAWRTQARVPYLTRADAAAPHGALAALFRDSAQALRQRSFRALFAGSVCSFAAWGVTTSLSMHFGTYFWEVSTTQMILWGVGDAIGTLIGLAWWPRVAARLDKRGVFMIGMSIYVVFLAGGTFCKMAGFFPAPESWLYVATWIATTGFVAHFGLAGTMVTGPSMMADVTDADALRYGRRREGIFFGAVSFSAKAAFGVGGLVAGFVIDWVAIPPGTPAGGASPEAVWNLGLALGISIFLLCGLSVLALARYDLDRERHARIRAALEAPDRNPEV